MLARPLGPSQDSLRCSIDPLLSGCYPEMSGVLGLVMSDVLGW